MKLIKLNILWFVVPFAIAGCTMYSNVATNGDKVYFTANKSVFGIAMPSVVVCDAGGSGVSNCRTATK